MKMQPNICYALAMIYLSLSEATAAATGKPVGQLSSYLLREMSEGAPPEAVELCTFLADVADASFRLPETAH